MKALLGQMREVNNMDDLRIIEPYFNRDEQAIKETDAKFGKLCHSIAYNILNSHARTLGTTINETVQAIGY